MNRRIYACPFVAVVAILALASSLGAGGVAGGGFSPLYQVGGARSIQLAVRLQF